MEKESTVCPYYLIEAPQKYMSRYLKLSQMCNSYVIVETELCPKCRQELQYSVRNKVQIDKEQKKLDNTCFQSSKKDL
jgi:hypothetical protein